MEVSRETSFIDSRIWMKTTGVCVSTVLVGIFIYQSNLFIVLVLLSCKDTKVVHSVSEVATWNNKLSCLTWGGYGLYDKSKEC